MNKKIEHKLKMGTNFFVFPVSLLLLLSLALWWFVLHRSQIEQVYQHKLESLVLQAQVKAIDLGNKKQFPSLTENSPFTLLESKYVDSDVFFFTKALEPNWNQYTLIIKKEALITIEEKRNRRLFMISGEGSLLIFLLSVPIFMLYRLFLAEKKARKKVEGFFRMVSHELKTPVAGLHALLDTLCHRDLSSEDVRKYAQLGLQENTQLRSMIDNMLYLQKMDVDIFDGRLSEHSLKENLQSYVKKRLQIFPNQKIIFKDHCQKSCLAVFDSNLLQHVLENLVENAFKYSQDINAPIAITLAEKEDSPQILFIHIEDQGEGIDQNDLENIFKKFYRLQSSRNRTSGIGMGLYIVQKLVGRMNGSVEVVSKGRGKGTIFTIELPRVRQKNN